MRIGEPFETATCEGCQRPIRHVYWGNGGNVWEHFDDQIQCAPVSRAKPKVGTVEAFPAAQPSEDSRA